jgi:hypothetical protein
MLPEPSVDDVRALRAAGWARMGIVTAIIDKSGRIMMLEHEESDKTPQGALGPLAETAQYARTESGIVIETTSQTLSRAIAEELAIDDPASLDLRAKRVGAWTLNQWPVGVAHGGQWAMAVCPVVHIGRRSKRELLEGFAGAEEIKAIRFMDPHDIVAHSLTRPGTREWVRDVMASGLTTRKRRELAPMVLPSPRPLPNAMDVKIATMDHV